MLATETRGSSTAATSHAEIPTHGCCPRIGSLSGEVPLRKRNCEDVELPVRIKKKKLADDGTGEQRDDNRTMNEAVDAVVRLVLSVAP